MIAELNKTHTAVAEASTFCDYFKCIDKFRYSLEFYLLKVRQRLHRGYPDRYTRRSSLFDAIAIKFLRYPSCCTLLLEKWNIYQR